MRPDLSASAMTRPSWGGCNANNRGAVDLFCAWVSDMLISAERVVCALLRWSKHLLCVVRTMYTSCVVCSLPQQLGAREPRAPAGMSLLPKGVQAA